MTISRARWASFGLVAATVAAGAYAYWRLPAGATIAAHYNLAGQAIGAEPKGQVLAILPAVAILVIGLLSLLPRVTPNAERLERSRGAYDVVLTGVAGVLFVAEASIAAKALSPGFDLLRTVFLAMAVMLVVVGNVVGKIRQNWLVGVRTPWTLGDERVWDKTHRFTGWAMVLGGIVLIPLDLIAPSGAWLIVCAVACAASPLVIGAAYSARIWRREHA
jgi:uncharacterized membrane protein